MVYRPSPSLKCGFPSSLTSCKGFVVLTQPLPCRTWFGHPLMIFSMFLRNFSKIVEPQMLHPAPWVFTLVQWSKLVAGANVTMYVGTTF